jgi:putative protein-disulfide isomerase
VNLASDQPAAPGLLIEYYTDPLCPRSWAFEPYWRRLRAEFGHRFAWCYRLSGALLGQATDTSASSYLACLAVKCAERQSQQAGNLYLCALREAALAQGRDITRPESLVAVAEELAAQVPGLRGHLPPVFDAVVFRQDLTSQAGAHALQEDMRQARCLRLQQLPVLVLRRVGQPHQALVLSDQPYEVLLHELARMVPDLFYVPSLMEGGAG